MQSIYLNHMFALRQMHKTKVTYYKSPHHLVHTDANQFLKSQQPGESDPLPSHTPPASND